MTMQTSEKFARNAKSKAKPGWSKKMQAVKEENTGDVVVKLESQANAEPESTNETTLDSRKFNGHLENSHPDQDVPILPPSSLRPPTRDVTPTSHQMLVGPNGQLGGPPPNCLAPVGPQMPGAMAPGGQMQLAAGGHFLQNHNQVFVFSTAMANHAALLVKSGQFKNIIDFHVNHPDTQQFLQKCSMGSPLPGMTMNMRADGSMRQPGVPPDGIPESGSALANVAQWVQQQNANLQQLSTHPSSVNFSSPPDGGQGGLRPNGRYGRMIQQWGGSSPGPQPMPQDMIGPQGYSMCGSQPGFPPEMNLGGGGPNDMLHGSMPKENLTPQQLQKREEGLAHLRKIGQMLNIDSSGGPGPGPMMHMHGNPDGGMPGDGGWPPGPMMHPNMGMARPRMALSPTDAMMGMNFAQRMGPFAGPGGMPQDWDNMTPEQKDWHKMQHEFYLDKCRKQQQMQQMGMNVPPGSGGGGGPNRSHLGFFHPMQQMHRMPGPMSPIPPAFPGSSVSSPHCGPMGVNPNDPQAAMMFAKQSEFGGLCQGMGPDQNFDHPGGGGMPRDGMFPFPDNPGMMGSMSGGESFSPAEFSHPGNQPPGGMVKMTPAYATQKRKRSANTMSSDPEDVYKRLLPAPSPQQFSYMNSLDGQELTITKQLNHAFQEQQQSGGGIILQPPTSSSPATYPPPQKSRSSGGAKKKKSQPKSDQKSKSQRTPPSADPFTCPSPAVPPASAGPSASASFQSAPAASPISQTSISSLSSSLTNVVSTPTAIANRASSADPNLAPVTATTMASASAPVLKSSMTNITSASLANLAKGVENLSAQIQHNPFRTVQMQENESDVSDVSPPDNSSLMPSSIGPASSQGPGPPQTSSNPQNNNNGMGGPMHSIQGGSSSMQQMTPTHLMGSPPGSVRSGSHSMAPKQDPGNLMTCGGRQSSPIFPVDDPGLDPGSRFCFAGGPGGPSGNQQMFSQMGPSPGGNGCRPTNGGNMVTGNAKIQIQAQTPNTIQYLPSGGGGGGGGGHPGDGMGDGFMEFQVDGKAFGKGGVPPYGAMMDGIHGSMMSGEMIQQQQQRRQMDLQMMQEAQMRMDGGFDPMHGGPRVSMHGGPRGSISGPSGSMHMQVGSMHGPGSPILTSSGMMHGMGNAMHGPGSPGMGPSGSMHDQTSPMMGPGSMMGPGGHMMGELLQMQGHMKQGMGLNGGADFGGMVMGPGGRGGPDMMQDMGPMTMQHRSMHPDAMMMSGPSPPEFSGPHRGDPSMMGMMSGCGGMMGPEMGMATMGGREGMMVMRGAPPGMRPEMAIERSRSNRSRQKARAAEESRIRSEAAGMMVGDGGRMGGGPGSMVGMDMMMRSEMGMMGMRPDIMGMSGMGPGDRMGMRPEQGMMVQRGNGMPPEMAMMGSRGTSAGRMGMMEGMPQESMFNFGPSRRGMPPEAMDMMVGPGMSPSGMCPPGMKSMVMGGSGVGQQGPGMDPGYGVPYQQFQQQLYAQSRSPTMSPGMMRGGMPGGPGDMMGRPQYDVMGPGPSMTPGSGMGFGQPQPGLGPM